jgi:hypothetical protein
MKQLEMYIYKCCSILRAAFFYPLKPTASFFLCRCGSKYSGAGKTNYTILWQTPLNFTACSLMKSSMQN